MARLVALIIALGFVGQLLVPLAIWLQPIVSGAAVVVLALVGLWLIITAPFGPRSRI
jgi:hypothetical protein